MVSRRVTSCLGLLSIEYMQTKPQCDSETEKITQRNGCFLLGLEFRVFAFVETQQIGDECVAQQLKHMCLISECLVQVPVPLPGSSFLQMQTLEGNAWWPKYLCPCHKPGSQKGAPSSWLWSGTILVAVAMWEVNHEPVGSRSLSFTLLFQ